MSSIARPEQSALVLGAIGIVYGDIGTSPIYAFREALRATSVGPPTDGDVLGLLSLILWSLTLIVTLDYVCVVLRADNHGEGGSLSLLTLARACAGRAEGLIGLIGMIGACLFIGDAVITPAIAVLSAVEGVHIAAPEFGEHVTSIIATILVTLFAVQRFGTDRVSVVFTRHAGEDLTGSTVLPDTRVALSIHTARSSAGYARHPFNPEPRP